MRLAGLLLLALPAAASAHRLDLTVSPTPDRLRVTAGYDDGTPADGATVSVCDATGAEVGRAVLDADGAAELPRPAGRWTVRVDDGAGHRASVSGETGLPVGSGRGLPRWLAVAVAGATLTAWVGWRRFARR